jgi:hypothetical protein
VKQAPFKVLVGATMPAALVEVGFISNPEEEAKLQSASFRIADGRGVDARGAAVQDELRNAHRPDPARGAGRSCARDRHRSAGDDDHRNACAGAAADEDGTVA